MTWKASEGASGKRVVLGLLRFTCPDCQVHDNQSGIDHFLLTETKRGEADLGTGVKMRVQVEPLPVVRWEEEEVLLAEELREEIVRVVEVHRRRRTRLPRLPAQHPCKKRKPTLALQRGSINHQWRCTVAPKRQSGGTRCCARGRSSDPARSTRASRQAHTR